MRQHRRNDHHRRNEPFDTWVLTNLLRHSALRLRVLFYLSAVSPMSVRPFIWIGALIGSNDVNNSARGERSSHYSIEEVSSVDYS